MGGGGPSHSPFDIFESFFGGGAFGGKRIVFGYLGFHLK
jgi:hypothetical protein